MACRSLIPDRASLLCGTVFETTDGRILSSSHFEICSRFHMLVLAFRAESFAGRGLLSQSE